MSLCCLWCWFLSIFSHFVPHCDHFCACFVSAFSQLASLCSFKIILHSPLVSVELSDRRYLPQRYAVAASSCFLWVTCSFVFRWEPSGCGKAESVCRELKRAAAEIRRRTSQNKTISERRELFLARLSLRLWSVLHRESRREARRPLWMLIETLWSSAMKHTSLWWVCSVLVCSILTGLLSDMTHF